MSRRRLSKRSAARIIANPWPASPSRSYHFERSAERPVPGSGFQQLNVAKWRSAARLLTRPELSRAGVWPVQSHKFGVAVIPKVALPTNPRRSGAVAGMSADAGTGPSQARHLLDRYAPI